MTKIANDFLVDKATLSDKELLTRFGAFGWKIFCKDITVADDDKNPCRPPCQNGSMLTDFATRHSNLRAYMLSVAKPRIEGLAVHKFNDAYPGYTFGGGRKVACIQDICEMYATEPYDDAMRGMISFISNGMWGTYNHWAMKIEAYIMELLKLVYTGKYCDKESSKRSSMGGCIKHMIVRLKQMVVSGRIRKIGKNVHHEVILKKRPKKMPAGMCELIVANSALGTGGFNGIIGRYETHPSVIVKTKLAAERFKNSAPEIAAACGLSQAEIEPELAQWVLSRTRPGLSKRAFLVELMTNAPDDLKDELKACLSAGGDSNLVRCILA